MPAALNEWPTGPSAAADFCNKIGTFRTSRDVQLESAMRAKADMGPGDREARR
jgi:hypothetical protein